MLNNKYLSYFTAFYFHRK